MAGEIRLFEKMRGLLVEVATEKANALRASHRVSRLIVEIDVLWTAEEEAARDAEEAAAKEAEGQRAADEAAQSERRTAALAKLSALGLSAEDFEALR